MMEQQQQDRSSRINPHDDAHNRNRNTQREEEDATISKKLFFTTTDLIDKINSVLSSSAVVDYNDTKKDASTLDQYNHEDDQHPPGPCFELQRRLPDGSTRKATTEEVAAADFQAKLKQSAEMVSQLTSPEEKLQWAHKQRQAGNELYAQQQYQEAMDVYLTCLVAMEGIEQRNGDDSKCSNNTGDESSKKSSSCWKQVTEEQIQLPVLLNLAACTLKLAMYKKTKTFCDLAIDLPCGQQSPKAFFRRAKAHMLMGCYQDAKRDLVHCLGLVKNDTEQDVDLERIKKEMTKLDVLIKRAEVNRQRQKIAMQRVFSGKSEKKLNDGNGNAWKDNDKNIGDLNAVKKAPSNDDDTIHKRREYSTLRAPWYYEINGEDSKNMQQHNEITSMGVLVLLHVQSVSMFVKQYLGRFLNWITRNKIIRK